MNGHTPSRPDVVVDWRPPRRPPRRRGRLFLLAVLAALILGAGTTLSYYVEALWYDSLGYAAVFWTTLNTPGAWSSARSPPSRSSCSTARSAR